MIEIFTDFAELNVFAAEKFVALAQDAVETRGRFTVALSGGSTPKALHELLVGDKYKNKVEWKQVFFFFGDERNVAFDDEESNFRMANETLFQPLKIAETNVYRWQTESKDAVANYEETLKDFFQLQENEFPRFDLILLGMGGDGHTASLFPLTEALKETRKLAVANRVEKLDATRLTLTFPTINNAANIIFLVKGADKAEILRTVLECDFHPEEFPAQNIEPENGEMFWLIDAPAAALLER